MTYLARQESVLPPDYKLQLVWTDGIPRSVPVGTSKLGQLEMQYGALQIRERIARELLKLFQLEFGYDDHDLRVICTNDLDGNEGVSIKAMRPPRNNWHEQLQTKKAVPLLRETAEFLEAEVIPPTSRVRVARIASYEVLDCEASPVVVSTDLPTVPVRKIPSKVASGRHLKS